MEQTQQPVAASVDYSAQIELLKAKNQELIQKSRRSSKFEDMQKQLNSLQQERPNRSKPTCETGQFESLWREANDANASLKNQIAEMQSALEAKDQQFTQRQIKSGVEFIRSSGCYQPRPDVFPCTRKLRFEGDQLTAVDGGVSMSLGEYVQKLKQPDTGWDHHFRGNGSVGMGSGSSSPGAGMNNLYLR